MSERVKNREPHAQRSDSERPSGLRLKELMSFVIVLALACYFWGFFKSTRARVSYQSLEVPKADLQTLEGDWHEIASSPYRWRYLTQDQFESHLSDRASAYRTRSKIITQWSQDYLDGYEHPGVGPMAENAEPLVSLGRLHGTVGARMAGDMLQLRVDLAVTHQQLPKKNRLKPTRIPEHELAGTIRYDGYAPQQYLLFAAPLKESVHHVLLFEAKNWEASRW